MYVYIMHEPPSAGRRLVKVGISDNPARRLRENTTGNPHDLVLRSSYFCGDKAKLIEGLVKKQFKDYATKKRGEWFSADIEDIESFMVSLVRLHCGYDPMVEDRIREERARYAEIMRTDEDGDSEDDYGDADEEIRLNKRLQLARDLPVEAGDMPFVDWYVGYWLPDGNKLCGLERLGKASWSKLLNIDALIEALTSGDLYDDDERDQIPEYIEIVDLALDLWGYYKHARRLNDKERKRLALQLDGFVKHWDSMGVGGNGPNPSQTIAGRSIHLSNGKPDCRIFLGFGFTLHLRLAFESRELLYPDGGRKKKSLTGASGIHVSHIEDAWVECGHHGVTRDRHAAVIQAREIALASFLKTECPSCFKPAISNLMSLEGTFLKGLEEEIRGEQAYFDRHHPRQRAAFRNYADDLLQDAMKLTRGIYGLFTSQTKLRSDIATGEFDHIDGSSIAGIDVEALMRTIAYGRSWEGERIARQMKYSNLGLDQVP